MECDVAVIGAGAAGLGAAGWLRGRCRCLVLEASPRVGGRAWTVRPEALGGAAFDMGASWLHDAARNPLTRLARRDRLRVLDFAAVLTRRLLIGGQDAGAERGGYEQAAAAFVQAALLQADQEDIALAAVRDADGLPPGGPWRANILNWEASLIAAADPWRLSVRDWRDNRLDGDDFILEQGLGALVAGPLAARVLAPGMLRLETPVTAVDWRAAGHVRLSTPAGEIAARRCIVTVSAGVLASGVIRFAPALPPALEEAVSLLPMGVLTKIAVPLRPGRASPCGGAFTSLERQLALDEPGGMIWVCHPFGASYVTGFVGEPAASRLEREGVPALRAHAEAEMRHMLGADAAECFAWDRAVVTGWGGEPWHRGAYCHAVPGGGGVARERLRQADRLTDGRLLFAGEATHPTHAGTAGGAYLMGREAARKAWP